MTDSKYEGSIGKTLEEISDTSMDKPDVAVSLLLSSIAISLKRIADQLEQRVWVEGNLNVSNSY